jgi:hypothetical protein
VDNAAADRHAAAGIAQSIAAFHWRPGRPTAADHAAAAALPAVETAETVALLEEALGGCRQLAAGAVSRRPARVAGLLGGRGAEVGPGGYFMSMDDGLPVLQFAYSQMPLSPNHTASPAALGLSLTTVEISPAKFFEATSRALKPWAVSSVVGALDLAAASGQNAIVFLGNGRPGNKASAGSEAFPPWAEAEYPGLTTDVGATSFFAYDIDNPGAKVLWDEVLAAAVPAVADHAATLSWALANEPGFDKANSSYTRAAFSQHLNATYAGNLSRMSLDWGLDPEANPLTSFTEGRVHLAMGYAVFSAQQQLAWGLFNQQRVTAWFTWLCGSIQHHYGGTRRAGAAGAAAAARCHLKGSTGRSPFGGGHGAGIDRVALARSMPIASCDTRAELLGRGTMNNEARPVASHMPFYQLNATAYSIDWWSMAASYDFMRTVSAPGTPVWDTEWHPFSTTHYRDPALPRAYVEAVGVLGALHGLSGTVSWYWGRSGWSGAPFASNEFGGADFFGSMTTQPGVMDAYSSFAIAANTLAVEIAAMAGIAPTIGLLYSEASSLMDPAHRDLQLATYTLAHFLHGSIRFVPSDVMTPAAPPAATATAHQTPPTTSGLGVLFVAGVSYISDAELDGLRRLATAPRGGGGLPARVVLTGNATSRPGLFLYDERGRQRSPPPATLPWTRGLAFVDLGGEAGAGLGAFTAMRAALPEATATGAAAAVRCVVPEGGGRPVFGVLCRSAVVGGRATVGVVNLLNASAAVDFRCGPGAGVRCGGGRGFDLWRGTNVTVPGVGGIVLLPMAVQMLRFAG